MKFLIRRTSYHGDDKPPITGAEKVHVTATTLCTCKTLAETKTHMWAKTWFWRSDKFNQREVPGGTACDYKVDSYAISVGSLEDLMELVEAEGRIVIEGGDSCYGNGPRIEIYGSYRE